MGSKNEIGAKYMGYFLAFFSYIAVWQKGLGIFDW